MSVNFIDYISQYSFICHNSKYGRFNDIMSTCPWDLAIIFYGYKSQFLISFYYGSQGKIINPKDILRWVLP